MTETQSTTTLHPLEVQELLEQFISNKKTVMITGTPGSGKTCIVSQTAENLGYDLVISHPAIQSPTDYRGMPVYAAQEDRAKFMPYEALERLVTTDKPTIFFLDDFGQSLPSVQAAIQNLLSSRQIGDHKISDKVVFVIATNDRKQGANVSGVLSTIKSRCASIINLETDAQHWLHWATQNGIAPEVTGFIRLRPELLSQFTVSNELVNFPCPRTVENLSDILKMKFSSNIIKVAAIAGAVGEAFCLEFTSFLTVFNNIVSPDYILTNPETAEIPDNPSVIFAVTSALAYRANKSNLQAIMTYGDRFSSDMVDYVVKMIEKDTMSRHPELKETSEYLSWVVKYQEHL